jgi:NAD-dependent deacetylase
MIVVGTSLQVYPAAGLLDYVPSSSPVFLVDPKAMASSYLTNVTYIKKTAVNGLPELVRELINAHSQ